MDTWIIFILYQYLGTWFIVILIQTAKPHFLPIKRSVGTQNMIKKEFTFWIEWKMDGIFLGYFLFGFFNAGELQFWFYILNSFFFLRGSNCCGVSRFLSFFRQQRKYTHVSILKVNCQMDLNTCFVETNTYNKNKQSWFCFRSATISMYKFSVVHSPQKSRILYKER